MGAPAINEKKVIKVANYFLKNQDETIGAVCKKFNLSRPTVGAIRQGAHKHLPTALSKRLSKKQMKVGKRKQAVTKAELNALHTQYRALGRKLDALSKKIHK